MTVSYGGISHISREGVVVAVVVVKSSNGTSSSIAPHLGLPSLPQCIALGDRWTERKIRHKHIKYRERKAFKTGDTRCC